MKRSTRLLTLLWIAGSLPGCATGRPDADVCIVNAPNKTRKCYNLKRDYQDDGHLMPVATPTYRPTPTLDSLNKALVLDSEDGFEEGIARVKGWVKKLREAAKCDAVGPE